MGLFDTHAHYDDSRFCFDRIEIIEGLRLKNDVNPLGVSLVVNSASDYESSVQAQALADKYDFIYATAGVHPHEAAKVGDELEEKLTQLLSHKKTVALGEIGLDYHYEDGAPRDVQLEIFRRQMELAYKLGKKVVIHDREAHGDCMTIVNEFKGKVIGEFHSFSGSFEMATELIKLGWYVSFSGTVTFKNANNVARSVLAVPDDRLLIETDAPYLAPVPYRGKTNNSSLMYETAKKIAEIRGKTVEEIAEITLNNGKKFFGITD